MLEASLKKQVLSYEYILIDNTKNIFSSAAKALNHGAQQAKGDILIFAHQDILFEDAHFLGKIEDALKSLPTGSLIGLAGVNDSKGVYTNIKQGPKHENAGTHELTDIIEVQTLDEVLIACHKETFNVLKFDEKTCDNWHLYGVDLSLSNLCKGNHSFVLPLTLYHLSSGKISLGYALTLFKVVRKHRRQVPYIYTTCSTVKTSRLRSYQYVIGLIWDHVIKKGKL